MQLLDYETEAAVTQSASGALESMCFAEILQSLKPGHPNLPLIDDSWQAASLTLSGDVTGNFAIAVSPQAASIVASNFLGLEPEEVSAEQVEDVLSELTNIVAGSMVSSLESNGNFHFSHPEACKGATVLALFPTRKPHVFQLEEGFICIWLQLSN